MRRPRAAVLVSGSELLDGRRRDANGHRVAARLAEHGVSVEHLLVVPDRHSILVRDLRFLLAQHPDVVIVSGGLGTTHDDLTAAAVAEALQRPLREHPEARDMVERGTAAVARRRALDEDDLMRHTLKLAQLPEGASPLPPVGLAPGFALQSGPTRLYALPGVPHELEGMLDDVLADLSAAGLLPAIATRRAGVFGVGEIEVAGIVESSARDALEVALTASYGEVWVSIRHEPGDSIARRQADRLVAALRHRVPVFSSDGRSVDAIVGDALRARTETLATAESCSGGLLGARMTEAPGSSEIYVGGVVAYANEVKTAALDVPATVLDRHGAVSEEAAAAMAEGVVTLTGATYGVAVTGIAGPSGGTADKPVGLVYTGCAGRQPTDVRRHRFPGDRETVRRWAVAAALHHVRERLAT